MASIFSSDKDQYYLCFNTLSLSLFILITYVYKGPLDFILFIYLFIYLFVFACFIYLYLFVDENFTKPRQSTQEYVTYKPGNMCPMRY
jgi:hypothetical protein